MRNQAQKVVVAVVARRLIENSTPNAVTKTSPSDAQAIARCDGVIPNTNRASRTVNHSSDSALTDAPARHSLAEMAVKKHSPPTQ